MFKNNIFNWAHSSIKRRHPEWNKVCPHCKRKSFSPLIDTRTERPVDDKNCGICDHKDSCGYKMGYAEWKEKYGPKQGALYKTESPEMKLQRLKESREANRAFLQRKAEEKANSFDPYRTTQPPKVQEYLDCMMERCLQMHIPNNTLMDYLYNMTSKEKAEAVFDLYLIGSTKKREVIYWQVDRYKRVRTGKIMDYNRDGHRKKEKNATWVHCQDFARLETKEQLAPQCLFGEHLIGNLIANPPKDGKKIVIGLVEAEKTAIIASIYYPEVIWVATGSKYNFTEKMLEVIKPFDVAVYPDTDALDEWRQKMEALKRNGYHLYMPPQYEALCEKYREKKWDLVDMWQNGIIALRV